MMRTVISNGVGLGAALLAANGALGATLAVPADHSTITAAIASASPGDTVSVAAGTYSASTNGESFPLTISVLGLELQGAGLGATVLDAEGSGQVVRFETSGAGRVTGFTITGGLSTRGAGVFVASGTPEIDHNLVLRNGANFRGAGIFALETAAPWIHHNVVWECFDTDSTDAIDPHSVLLADTATGVVEHNLIGRSDGNGLLTSHTAMPSVRHNIFVENGVPEPPRGRGICWLADSPAIIFHNLFYANQIAAILWTNGGGNFSAEGANDVSPADSVFGNLDGDPLLLDPDGFDFGLSFGSPAIDAGEPSFPLDPDGTVADLGPFYYPQVTGAPVPTLTGFRASAWPNPFRDATRLTAARPEGESSSRAMTDLALIEFEVFDLSGRRLRRERTSADVWEWDGRDATGRAVAAGVYWARVTRNGVAATVPIVRLR